MIEYYLKLADKVIAVKSCYERSREICRNYLIDPIQPDISIKITLEMIEEERTALIQNMPETYTQYSNQMLEHILIYKLISEKMLNFSTILMHGSVIATDVDNGFMFIAASGVGKTTHSNLWLKQIPSSYIVNGDKPLIIVNKEAIFACGTPWAGKEGMNRNCKVPLKGICFLERSETNSIRKIDSNEALPLLIQQANFSGESEKLLPTLSLLVKISKRIPCYHMLMNNFKDNAFCTSYNEMVRGHCQCDLI